MGTEILLSKCKRFANYCTQLQRRALIAVVLFANLTAIAQIAPQVWNRLSPTQRMQLAGAYLFKSESAERTANKAAHILSTRPAQKCQSPVDKKNLSIYIGLGYENGERSITEDHVTFDATKTLLTRKCSKNVNPKFMQLCGFSPIEGQPQLLQKKILRENGESTLVQIEINTSSLTPYDYDNQNRFKDEQKQKSDSVRDQFLNALSTHDVVFYVGHSRDGGGPDFHPPVLLPEFRDVKEVKGDQVDYNYYAQNTERITSILDRLQKSEKHAEVIGLFSCDSAKHFYTSLSQVAAEGTLLLTTTQVTEKSMDTMLAGLNGILTGQCDKSLDASMHPFDGRVLRTKK